MRPNALFSIPAAAAHPASIASTSAARQGYSRASSPNPLRSGRVSTARAFFSFFPLRVPSQMSLESL
uniref:Uncharacterized protein n=1 Tax=Arundo donax TaxID=35708 RepID=A0A0A9E5N5_ARUDO